MLPASCRWRPGYCSNPIPHRVAFATKNHPIEMSIVRRLRKPDVVQLLGEERSPGKAGDLPPLQCKAGTSLSRNAVSFA